MSPRILAFAAAAALSLGGIAGGCSDHPAGPGPGSTPPGHACSQASDCGCWQCECQGVGGAPGAAQLCVSGTCPTGEQACTPICAIVDASLASATSVGTCNGVP